MSRRSAGTGCPEQGDFTSRGPCGYIFVGQRGNRVDSFLAGSTVVSELLPPHNANQIHPAHTEFNMWNVFIVLALCLTSIAENSAADWPQWRGPGRDGKSTETGLDQNWNVRAPELVWMTEGLGEGYASLAMTNGMIFTTGNRSDGQYVAAFSAEDGTEIWATRLTDGNPDHSYPGSRCTPTVDGDRVYAVTSDGQIGCVRVSDGELIWKRHMREEFGGRMMSGWGYSESPLVDGDLVLCTPGAGDAMIVALDKLSGEEVWRSAVPNLGEAGKDGAAYSSIVATDAAGVRQYVTIVGRGAIGVRASDGEFLWGYNRIANGTANIPTAIPVENFVFVSTGYGTGAALLELVATEDGNVAAQEKYFLNARTFENHHGGMILEGDYVYAGHQHGQGFPICIAWRTGEVVWGGDIRGADGDGSGSAAITYVDGQIIFRYQNGEVALVNATPEGYELLGHFRPEYQERESWSHPVVVDGKMYLREQNRLMCYDLVLAAGG